MGKQNQMMGVFGGCVWAPRAAVQTMGVVAIREVESRGKGQGWGAGPHPVGQEEAGERGGGGGEEDLSPSCESVPDPKLNNSILDPDMRRRMCEYVCIEYI